MAILAGLPSPQRFAFAAGVAGSLPVHLYLLSDLSSVSSQYVQHLQPTIQLYHSGDSGRPRPSDPVCSPETVCPEGSDEEKPEIDGRSPGFSGKEKRAL